MARPAVTLPPGLHHTVHNSVTSPSLSHLLIYMWMGFLALSDWRKRSCATTMLLT